MNQESTIVRHRDGEISAIGERSENKTTRDLPESPGAAFWSTAWISMPEGQTNVHLRVDSDVVEWFKAAGRGHRSLMSAILKAYVEAQKQTSSPELGRKCEQ